MNGYKGKIGFYKSLFDGRFIVHPVPDGKTPEEYMDGYWIYLGAFVDVDVKFIDTRHHEIERLERAIEQERAESQRKINIMLGKIQELQALEHIEN